MTNTSERFFAAEDETAAGEPAGVTPPEAEPEARPPSRAAAALAPAMPLVMTLTAAGQLSSAGLGGCDLGLSEPITTDWN